MPRFSYTQQERAAILKEFSASLPKGRVCEAMSLLGEHGKRGAAEIMRERILRCKTRNA